MSADVTPPQEPRALWQGQPTPTFRMSADDLRAKVVRSQQTLRRRTLVLYSGAAVEVAVLAGVAIAVAEPVVRIGALLSMISFGYMILQMRLHHGFIQASDASLAGPPNPSITFYRADLERYRDFNRGIGLWSRLVLSVPAGCVLFYGLARANPELAPYFYAMIPAFLFLGLVVGIPVQLRRARRYQEQIDELDALQAPS